MNLVNILTIVAGVVIVLYIIIVLAGALLEEINSQIKQFKK